MKPSPSSKHGSVLLITLLVVSLLLVIVLSFAVYVRMELRQVRNRQLLMEARSAAQMAMHLGLNQLQMHGGRDRAATARAEILGPSVTGGNRYWAGIWDATDPASPPVWLVSGTSPDPASTVGDELLVGSESVGDRPDEKIAVPEVSVGTVSYSWYVSDEGVKADISPIDAAEDIALPGYANAEDNFTHRDTWRLEKARKLGSPIAALQGMTPAGSDFTHVAQSVAERADNQETEWMLARLHTYLDTTIDWPTPVDLGEDFPKETFHDFTVNTRSVLSNPLDGGLKQDLSHLRRIATLPSQSTLDAVFDAPQWEYLTPAIWEFANFDRLSRFGDLNTTPPTGGPKIQTDLSTGYMDGPVSFHTSPIATEFTWISGLGIRSTSSGPTRDIYLYFYTTLEMLNPYVWSLNTGNGWGSTPQDPADLQLRIRGFPPLRIENITQNRSMTLDLSDLVVAIQSNSYQDHFPGYMRTNFSPTSDYNSVTGNNTGVFAIKVGEFPATPGTRDDFRVTFDTGDLEIEIGEAHTHARSASDREHWAFFLTDDFLPPGVPRFSPPDDPSAAPRPIQTFTLRNWGGFSIYYEGGVPGDSNQTRFVHGGSAMERGRIRDTINFGVHGKLVDEWPEVDTLALMTEQALDALLTHGHPARKRVEIDMTAPEDGDGEFFDFRQPWEISRSAVNNFDDTFYGKITDFSAGESRIARLFDLPSGELFSVAAFNQLQFNGFPYQPLGNRPSNRPVPTLSGSGEAPGQSLHNYFDRYFFSTLPVSVDAWNGTSPLPNQRIVKARSATTNATLASPDSAEELLVKGGFNLNSLSPQAWTAILQHAKPGRFVYTDADHIRRTRPLGDTAFFNHPYGGDHHIEDGAPTDYSPRHSPRENELAQNFGIDASHEAFIQGYRVLSAARIAELADAIVENIRAYTQANQSPLPTFTHFLNEGILQNAVDQVEGLNRTGQDTATPDDDGRIPTLSPAYFGPGSILNHLSTHLFTRSDTFIIRSSGKILDPASNDTRSSAYLETRVQRMPADGADPYGRRFRITGMKWIDVRP